MSYVEKGTKKEDAMMLRRAKMSMRQVHGNFRPSSATRRVRGAWGNKALDLEGLSQELPADCMGDLRASALVDEARVVEKNVKNLQFQSRVVNERGPAAGRLRVNVDYVDVAPAEAEAGAGLSARKEAR